MPATGWFAAAGVLLVVTTLASRVADRLGVPSLLAFIGVGMVIGSDILGWVHFDDAATAQVVGSIALAYILFSGGLDTSLSRIREVTAPGVLLSTAGVLFTALVVAVPAMWLLGWSFPQSFLLGSVVASTDAAAVFAVMRGRGVGIRRRLASLLELESGSNDPMALLLVIGTLQWMAVDAPSFAGLAWMFVVQLVAGAAIGLAAGMVLPPLLNGARLQQEGLYPVLTISAVLAIYGIAETVGGNPFLAIYLAGVGLGNATFVHRTSITRFHDGLGWLMQVVMFLVLGLLAFPSRLVDVLVPGLVLGAVLMLVARPLAVALLLLPMGWSLREVGFLGWVGLKGAVPIVLATFPLVAGAPHADVLVLVVFFMVLLSATVQGSTVRHAARFFGVAETDQEPLPSPLVFAPRDEQETTLIDLQLASDSAAIGRRIFELALPQDTLIVVVQRDGKLMVPRGEFELRSGDHVQVLAHKEDLAQVRAMICGRASC